MDRSNIERGDKTRRCRKICPYSKRILERWLVAYKKGGKEALQPKSTRPKTNLKETPIRLKEKIIQKRKDKGKCALKLKWDLQKEGIKIHHRTIGKILKQEGLLRKYRVKRVKYKYIRAKLERGELIEIDVKHVPHKLDGKKYYQYTAIDLASRWRHISIFDEESNHSSICFLKEVIERFSFKIKAIKTDNHSTFTNRYTGYLKSSDSQNPKLHALDRFCEKQEINHYLIDPGKPSQNGTVERSHRSDKETFKVRLLTSSFKFIYFQNRQKSVHKTHTTVKSAKTLTLPKPHKNAKKYPARGPQNPLKYKFQENEFRKLLKIRTRQQVIPRRLPG